MRKRTFPTLALMAVFALGACTAASPSASPSGSVAPLASAGASAAASKAAAAPPCAAESSQKDPVMEGVEKDAVISFWTYYLSPTFDEYIKCTIARYEAAYPGVKVNWEDHQATYLDDYRNSINAGTQPDVANLSNNEGWVQEFAQAGRLLDLTLIGVAFFDNALGQAMGREQQPPADIAARAFHRPANLPGRGADKARLIGIAADGLVRRRQAGLAHRSPPILQRRGGGGG